jgi:hypothetical protein
MADSRQRKRKPYSLQQLQVIMATAIRELETIFMNDGNDLDQRIRAINSLSSLCNSYSKLTETAELEARIIALEEKNNLRKVS